MNELKIPENASKNIHNVVEELISSEDGIKKVLDIPSGAGAFTWRMLKKEYDVFSGDIENILHFEHKNFVIADMNEPLPFEDGFFDAVVCIDGIEHLENPFKFIRECERILRKDGKLIISTPNIDAMRSRWRHFLTGHHNKDKSPLNENNPTPLHHINMFSYPRLRYILHTNGFKIEQVKTNRIKFISWFHAIFYPFARIKTSLVYRKEEKDLQQRKINRQILKDVYSRDIYFGETLIVKATKI